MMDTLKTAAQATSNQTQSLLSLPSTLISSYSSFITANSSAVGQVEGALRSLTYIIPGRFRESEIASESLNSGVQLLGLWHDDLLAKAARESAVPGRKVHQSAHSRYTKYYCQKSQTYKSAATVLQCVQYTELLVEMMAKRRGERVRWRVIVIVEVIKAMCRLILMRLTNSRPLLNPPLPERESVPEPVQRDHEEEIHSPPSERRSSGSGVSEAGSEQWTMPRTSLTLPPLPTSGDISSYLMSKVLTADDIKPPKALMHRVGGLGEAAEIMYILRPVIYAAAMSYWYRREGSRAKADWRPWLLGLSIEYGARQLAKRDMEMRRPGGARGLSQLEKEELKKRGWSMAWWGMRGAFYENVTKGVVQGVAGKLKGKPLLDMVGSFIEDYDYLWQEYYFPTATM